MCLCKICWSERFTVLNLLFQKQLSKCYLKNSCSKEPYLYVKRTLKKHLPLSALQESCKIHRKHRCRSLFFYKTVGVIKKRHRQRCYAVNYVRFFKIFYKLFWNGGFWYLLSKFSWKLFEIFIIPCSNTFHNTL